MQGVRVAHCEAGSVWGLLLLLVSFSKRLLMEAEGEDVWDRIGGQYKVGGLGIKMNLHTRSVSAYHSLAHPLVRLTLTSSKKMWKFL